MRPLRNHFVGKKVIDFDARPYNVPLPQAFRLGDDDSRSIARA